MWTAFRRVAVVAIAAFGLLASSATATVSPNNQLTLPSSGAPKGFVIVIHGGGWLGGASYVTQEDTLASWFNQLGYGAYNIDYSSGATSYFDVLSAYDWLHGQYPSAPICAWGESAGGHLALLLAASRSLKCVITQGAPTDFTTLSTQPADGSDSGSQFLYDALIAPIFGSNLSAWSPVTYCPNIQARLLLGTSAADPYVPPDQMYEMQSRCPNATAVLLEAGQMYFTHGDISSAAMWQWLYDMYYTLAASMP